MNGAQQQQSQLPSCSDFLKALPLVYKMLMFVWGIFWVLSTFLGPIFAILPNSYSNTIGGMQLWRIFTNVFYEPSLFMLMICLINFHTFLPSMVNFRGFRNTSMEPFQFS